MKLVHRDLGGVGRPPLVILHGMLGSSRNWQTAGRDLAERYHVMAPDLRNHGVSPHAPTMSYPEMADDVLAWLDVATTGPVTLMGHSMGGKVAMLIACRHPARVGRLVVVDMAPKDYFWPAHRANFAAMNELNLSELGSRADAEMRFEARVSNWATRKFLATNLERLKSGGWGWTIHLPAISAALPELEKSPLEPGDRYEGPARFIVGGKSRYVEPGDETLIRRHFPAAELVTIPEAGHNPHLETREKFVAAIPTA